MSRLPFAEQGHQVEDRLQRQREVGQGTADKRTQVGKSSVGKKSDIREKNVVKPDRRAYLERQTSPPHCRKAQVKLLSPSGRAGEEGVPEFNHHVPYLVPALAVGVLPFLAPLPRVHLGYLDWVRNELPTKRRLKREAKRRESVRRVWQAVNRTATAPERSPNPRREGTGRAPGAVLGSFDRKLRC